MHVSKIKILGRPVIFEPLVHPRVHALKVIREQYQ